MAFFSDVSMIDIYEISECTHSTRPNYKIKKINKKNNSAEVLLQDSIPDSRRDSCDTYFDDALIVDVAQVTGRIRNFSDPV